MICMRRASTAHPWSFFLSVVDASDADDEDSSSDTEEPAVKLSDESFGSEDSAVELSDECSNNEKADIRLSDERSSSSSSAVELSDEGTSRSEEQQPLSTSKTPPLDFPASPTPHEAVSDNGFNMDGYDQQSDYISGWYTTEEEVRTSPFNVLD